MDNVLTKVVFPEPQGPRINVFIYFLVCSLILLSPYPYARVFRQTGLVKYFRVYKNLRAHRFGFLKLEENRLQVCDLPTIPIKVFKFSSVQF